MRPALLALLRLLVAGAILAALPVDALAVSVPPLPSPVIATPSLPGTGLLGPSPVTALSPSPASAASPSPAPSPAAAPGAVGGRPLGGAAPGNPAPGTAAPAATPAPIAGEVIHAVVGSLPSEVPVFPILLPLLAGLFLLLVSAFLAAYRRNQEAHRFERLERTKSDFLNLASHELRTPLTVLLGYVSLIRDGDIKPDTPAFEKAMPIIEERLNQVNTIVEQMLEAARLEDIPDRLSADRIDLADVASDSVSALRARAGAGRPVELRHAGGELPVSGDRVRVASIVDQLLDNAVKYSPEGSPVECTLAAFDDHARLTVRDRGPGIPSDQLEHVFTRFGRLVTSDNSHIQGAGLGLYLARANARRMGGDVTVVSRPSRGSAFTLSLPLDHGPAPGSAPAKVQVGS